MRILQPILIEEPNHHRMNRQTLELKVSIVKGQCQIHMTQCIMIVDLPHSFDFGKWLWVLIENWFYTFRNLKCYLGLVIYRPVTLWYCETVHSIDWELLSCCLSIFSCLLLMHNSIILLTILDILHNDITILQCVLAKSHLKQLNILNLLLNVIWSHTH